MTIFLQTASANYVGTEISLNGKYGSSWDGPDYELWRVLNDAGYSALASDIYLDVTGGTPSSAYHAYQDSFWQHDSGYNTGIVTEVAGYAPNSRFGWYEKGYANEVGDISKTTWGQLFSGPDSDGAATSFVDLNQVGFWINPNGQSGLYYFTDTGSNGGNLQAVTFSLGGYSGYGNNQYLVCLEDLNYSGTTDNDFQDMIVSVTMTPEPATMALLGMGLFGLVGLRFKKKKI